MWLERETTRESSGNGREEDDTEEEKMRTVSRKIRSRKDGDDRDEE